MADTTLSLSGFDKLFRAARAAELRALRSGELAVLQGKKGRWIECESGAIWITVEKEPEDRVLVRGEGLRVPNGGKILASGQGSFRISA
ncbi:MAG: DUF2917 domain-containing protein [Spirochaetaceae bacterium]|nr:DUF2917 domain-containing protein [Spirochaetaceae bacterium]